MQRGAFDAYVARDADKARRLLRDDDIVDEDQDRVVREALREIREHPDASEQEIDLIFVAKNLERVADHATNVAESVILLVEGRNVKHAEKLASAAASAVARAAKAKPSRSSNQDEPAHLRGRAK